MSSVMVEPAAIYEPLPTFTGASKVGVAADEYVVADDRPVFFMSIVVDCDGAAAEVYPLTHVGIADICQM